MNSSTFTFSLNIATRPLNTHQTCIWKNISFMKTFLKTFCMKDHTYKKNTDSRRKNWKRCKKKFSLKSSKNRKRWKISWSKSRRKTNLSDLIQLPTSVYKTKETSQSLLLARNLNKNQPTWKRWPVKPSPNPLLTKRKSMSYSLL